MIQPTYQLLKISQTPEAVSETAPRCGLVIDDQTSAAQIEQFLGRIGEFAATSPTVQLVRLSMDISEPDLLETDARLSLIRQIQPPICEVQLASSSSHDKPDAARGDPRAVAICTAMLSLLDDSIDCLAIKPESGTWLRTLEHAVRLMMRVNRSRAGLTFSLPDWQAQQAGDMENALALVGPRLFNVWLGSKENQQSTEAALLERHLRLQGYAGPVGVSCPSV